MNIVPIPTCDGGKSITRAIAWKGVGPENRYMAIGLNDFNGANPLLGPLAGWALVMDLPASKELCPAPYEQQVH
jgi:hypothetical protein